MDDAEDARALAWADGVVRALTAGTLDGGPRHRGGAMRAEESVLRLADAAAVLATATIDEDTGLLENVWGLLSALDYALRGDPGCVEPSEWQERRRHALAVQGEYLGLCDQHSLRKPT